MRMNCTKTAEFFAAKSFGLGLVNQVKVQKCRGSVAQKQSFKFACRK